MDIDENTMNNIKNMVDSGNLEGAISQISPEMIQNFSKILDQQKQKNNTNTNNTQNNVQTESNQNEQSSFNFNNIDINTIMKMSSALGQINNSKNDPRANLLNSLKPYLRDTKKNQLDNYINMLNIAKVAEIMKDNNSNPNNDKENKNNV